MVNTATRWEILATCCDFSQHVDAIWYGPYGLQYTFPVLSDNLKFNFCNRPGFRLVTVNMLASHNPRQIFTLLLLRLLNDLSLNCRAVKPCQELHPSSSCWTKSSMVPITHSIQISLDNIYHHGAVKHLKQ